MEQFKVNLLNMVKQEILKQVIGEHKFMKGEI